MCFTRRPGMATPTVLFWQLRTETWYHYGSTYWISSINFSLILDISQFAFWAFSCWLSTRGHMIRWNDGINESNSVFFIFSLLFICSSTSPRAIGFPFRFWMWTSSYFARLKVTLKTIQQFFLLLFFCVYTRYSEEKCVGGIHLFSSCWPSCAQWAITVSKQEIICEEQDLPGPGIPQRLYFPECTTDLRTHCMLHLYLFAPRLACSQVMLLSTRY